MADMHLGMEPDKGMPWSKERGEELWDCFGRIIDLCVEREVDLLLIVGDLFHRQPTVADVKEMRYLLGKLRRTRVVLTAGNHDYLTARSRLPEILMGDRIQLLPTGEVSPLLIPACNATIYGISYSGRKETDDPFAGVRPHRTRGYHILMAHGGDAEHMPFERQALAQAGFDYVALGHIHKPERMGERMAYCGSPEPLDKTETGQHGVIYGELSDGKCRLEFVPMAARQYREMDVAVTEDSTLRGLTDQIREAVREQGQEDIYKIRLTGWRDPEIHFDTEQLTRLLSDGTDSCRVAEVTDHSRPFYDFEYLYRSNQGNLLGEFIRSVQEKDADDAWKEKVLAAGVEALLRTRADG